MNVSTTTTRSVLTALSTLTRLDGVLFGCGPLAILVIWALLPSGAPEGSRTADLPATGVLAELAGYALETGGEDRPRVLGRGAEADLRLHNAPVARRAALLLPPGDAQPSRVSWSALPVRPDLTLRLVPPGPESGEAGSGNGTRVLETSFRPWVDGDRSLLPFLSRDPEPLVVGCEQAEAVISPVRLKQLRLWGSPADGLLEPEIVWLEAGKRAAATGRAASVDVVSCPGGRVWWSERGAASSADPCVADADGWKRARICTFGRPAACVEPSVRSWGVRIVRGESVAPELLLPWGEGFHEEGLALTLSGPSLTSIRFGVDAGLVDPSCRKDCRPETVPLCSKNTLLETLGSLALRDGDVLEIGRTRFLVRMEGPSGARRPELYHVRNPRAAGYFRASSGHDVYHPNRRALWTVPLCAGGNDALTLMVRPEEADRDDPAAAELPVRDEKRWARIEAATLHQGVPQELPAVDAELEGERALLSICTVTGESGALAARLVVDSPRGVRIRNSAGDEILGPGEVEIPLGGPGEPEEALVTLDGNLIRIAPAANRRVTRHVRFGLAGYLVFVLGLQAVPLSLARAALGGRKLGATAWPAVLGAPTLQQLAGTLIALLLFVGASFQLFLALHPDLAGKPDYLQAFLQGVVVVSTVLAASAGFALGGARLPERAAAAALGAALALFGAAAWWAWDAWLVPAGLWWTAARNEAVSSSGAGPEAFGGLLVKTGSGALGLALVLFLSRAVPWPRWAEWWARRGLRVPVAGFAVLAASGLAVGIVRKSALAFELGIVGALAWYAGVYWAFVRRGRVPREHRLRRRAALFSLGSGLVILAFLVVFFLVGSDLPDVLSFVCVALGLGVTAAALRIMVTEKFTSLVRVLLLWGTATVFGCAFASLVLTDMGSVAAWIPALLAGLFLWLVRPEEQASRAEEPRKALSQLLLALGLGLVLLGVLDVFKTFVQGLEWQALDRPRQRLDLAEDVSYITAGEWITQVRWLASHQDGEFQWVPNVNSDVAVFGLSAGLGTWLAVLASLLVLGVAGCAALAADQALREGHAAAVRGGSDRLWPALYRGAGLVSGMVSVLLVAQWLVHLATGVVLHLPITGLVFPWISHGNTTHLLYAAAIVVPMAAVTALSSRPDKLRST